MVNVIFFFLILIFNSSMAFVKNEMKFPSQTFHRISRHNEHQQPVVRHLMGKLIDTETNIIYNIDGQKQQVSSTNLDGAISTMTSAKHIDDLACLEACYKCVEDFPLVARKKKAADNCGPMCDCADSCSRMPIEQIDKIYGQGYSARGDKTCFWNTYLQSLNNELPH